jgi:hypothetical protein
MLRIKEYLRRIIDQQYRDNKSNRDAYLDLDRQIKSLNMSLGGSHQHNYSFHAVRETSES